MKPLSETQITKIITDNLNKLPGTFVYKVLGYGNGKFRTKAGMTDLVVIHQGDVWFLEVKVPGNTLQPIQEQRHAEIQAASGNVAVVRSWDEVKEVMKIA